MRFAAAPRLLYVIAMLLVAAPALPACKPPAAADHSVAQRVVVKAEIAKHGIVRVKEAGGNPQPLMIMLHGAKAKLDSGDIESGEALLDQIIAQAFPDGVPEPPAEADSVPNPGVQGADGFTSPRRVALRGYADHAMEPFITRDGRYLLFNNSNAPEVDTNLYVARRIDDHTFDYIGELKNLSTPATDAVASVDRRGNMFYISTETYPLTFRTIFRSDFTNGAAVNPRVVAGDITRGRIPYLSMDAEISADGETLYYADNEFADRGYPKTSDIVIARRHGEAFHRLSVSERIMASINSDHLEYAPATTEDELTLYFTRASLENLLTSRGDAKFGIYMSTRRSRDEPFGTPSKITAIQGFVEAPTVAPDGAIYFHKNDGGKFVLYRSARQL